MSAYEIWPFQPRAFIGDTQHLTAAETGAYIRLLSHYWITGSLPADDGELARIAGVAARAWRRHYCGRLQPLFYDGWKHKRVERDLRAAEAFRQKQRRNIRKRWQKSSFPLVDNGEAFLTCSPGAYGGDKSLKSNGCNNQIPIPAYYHKERIDRIPFTAARVADVDNLQKPAHTRSVVDCFNAPSKRSSTPNVTFRRSQEEVLRALLSLLGEPAFAEAVEVFSAYPSLLDRATRAEMRARGSGAMAALIALRERVP